MEREEKYLLGILVGMLSIYKHLTELLNIDFEKVEKEYIVKAIEKTRSIAEDDIFDILTQVKPARPVLPEEVRLGIPEIPIPKKPKKE